MQLTAIEVFKTNIDDKETALRVSLELMYVYPGIRVNFDLDDCDNILRIEGHGFNVLAVINTVKNFGHHCEVLE